MTALSWYDVDTRKKKHLIFSCTFWWHLTVLYSSVPVISTIWCRIFLFSKKAPLYLSGFNPFLPHPASSNHWSASSHYSFAFANWPKRNHTIPYLLYLLSLGLMFLKFIHIFCMGCWFAPFCCWLVCRCTNILHSVYPFTSWYTFGLFSSLSYNE